MKVVFYTHDIIKIRINIDDNNAKIKLCIKISYSCFRNNTTIYSIKDCY